MTSSLQFHSPELLWLLLAIPLLAFLRGRRGKEAAVLFSSIALARTVSGR
ncbi:MAG: BatA domain-containing protein, partial [Verrucomicrobiota bacterium]